LRAAIDAGPSGQSSCAHRSTVSPEVGVPERHPETESLAKGLDRDLGMGGGKGDLNEDGLRSSPRVQSPPWRLRRGAYSVEDWAFAGIAGEDDPGGTEREQARQDRLIGGTHQPAGAPGHHDMQPQVAALGEEVQQGEQGVAGTRGD
jgi:hypothetical protein